MSRKLDKTPPLAPVFDARTRGKDRTADHDISTREERRRAFFERRGVPMPAPRPSWAHEQDRQSFNQDWQAERQAHQAQSQSTTQAKAIPRPTVERDTSREAFKAARRQQSQTRGMERGFDQNARCTSFARTIDL